MEFELLDTGVFDDDRYFDVVVEYAKADPEDICIRIEAFNRGPDAAELHVLPHLWFRNTWGWGADACARSRRRSRGGRHGHGFAVARRGRLGVDSLPNLMFEYRLGARHLYAPVGGTPLFTDNETNAERCTVRRERRPACSRRTPSTGRSSTAKRASTRRAPAPRRALHFKRGRAGGAARRSGSLRLTPDADEGSARRRRARSSTTRRAEADEFYAAIHPPKASQDEKLVQRQALAGMLWTKQIYLFDVNQWLDGDNPHMPPPASRQPDPQRALASSELDADPVDAGQVGVSVVRGVGPRVPLRRARAGRSRVREGQPVAAAVRAVPAPERADPRVRVGVLGPESAGARLGLLARLSTSRRNGPASADIAVSREMLPEAADQLRVVGEQGRQPGHERLRGRLPRARQHHGRRSQREAAATARFSSSRTPPAGWASSACT